MQDAVEIQIQGPRNDVDAALRDTLYGGSSKFSVERVVDAPEGGLEAGVRVVTLSWTRSRG